MNRPQAIQLLNILLNPMSSDDEKQSAYTRLHELMILLLPEE